MSNISKDLSSKSLDTKVTPEIYLLNLVRRLEEEVQRRTNESAHYKDQCAVLKKKLTESDSLKNLLYNYVNLQKKQLNKEANTQTQAYAVYKEQTTEPPKYNVESDANITENVKSEPKIDDRHYIDDKTYKNLKTLIKRACAKFEISEAPDYDSLDTCALISHLKKVTDHISGEQFFSPSPVHSIDNKKIDDSICDNFLKDLETVGEDIYKLVSSTNDEILISEHSLKLKSLLHNLKSIFKYTFPNSPDSKLLAGINEFLERQYAIPLKIQKEDSKKDEIKNDDLKNEEISINEVKKQLNENLEDIVSRIFEDKNIDEEIIKSNNSHKNQYNQIIPIINEFLLKIISKSKDLYKNSGISENEKLKLTISQIDEKISPIFDTYNSESKDLPLENKLNIIQDHLLSYYKLKNDREFVINDEELRKVSNDQESHENIRKAIIFITSKLDDYLEMRNKEDSNGFDHETADVVHKIVSSFNELLDTFSRKPIDLAEEIVQQLDSACSTLTQNLDASQKSLSNKMKDLKNLVDSLKVSDEKSKKRIEQLSELLQKSDERIIKLEEEIRSNKLNSALNANLLETSSQVANVAESMLKYSQDILAKGVKLNKKMDKLSAENKSPSESDGNDFDNELESINKNIECILESESEEDENKDDLENLTEKAEDQDENSKLDVNFKLKQLEDATLDLYNLNMNLIESKNIFENEQILKDKKIDTLIKSMSLFSKNKENSFSSSQASLEPDEFLDNSQIEEMNTGDVSLTTKGPILNV